jgi:hypothetical protein
MTSATSEVSATDFSLRIDLHHPKIVLPTARRVFMRHPPQPGDQSDAPGRHLM